MSTERPQKIWSTIDVVKIIAGTLAAVSAAVASSTFGVAGTLAGAALASVVGSIGTELYTHSLNRASTRLRRLRPGFLAVPVPDAVVDPDVPAAVPVTTDVTEAQADEDEEPPQRRWVRIVGFAGGAFVVAMLIIFGFELLAGRSLAGLFGDEKAGSTTIGSVIGDRGPAADATPTPATTAQVPSSSVTPSGSTSAEPSPSSTAPSPSAAVSVAPVPTPAQAGQQAPAEDAPAGQGAAAGRDGRSRDAQDRRYDFLVRRVGSAVVGSSGQGWRG